MVECGRKMRDFYDTGGHDNIILHVHYAEEDDYGIPNILLCTRKTIYKKRFRS